MIKSKGMGWVIVIIIVAVLAGAAWWYWSQGMAAQPPSASIPEASTSTQAAASQGSGASDAALTNDLSAIDGQMGSFASDDASVDSSLSDQPVQQSSL